MFPSLGPAEMMFLMVAAVLLFGKRLPEVGRSLGKGIVEFKKGLNGLQDEFHSVRSEVTSISNYHHDEPPRVSAPAAPVVPKFEPPTSAPVVQAVAPVPQD